MGLSDEERTNNIYHCIARLHEIKKNWDERYPKKDNRYKRIRELIDQTWIAFLGKQSNSIHWIFGSSTSNSVNQEHSDPWSVSICNHLDRLGTEAYEEEKGRVTTIFYDEDTDIMGNPRPFNAKDFLRIPCLMNNNKNYEADSFVFEIYQTVESIIYSLRRYNDEYRQRLNVLDELVSNLCGECFIIFKSNPDFAKAYLINQIMDILYGPYYPYGGEEDDYKWDVVTKLLSSEHFHHDFPRLMNCEFDIKELVKHHINLVKALTKAKLLAKEKDQVTTEGIYGNQELLEARMVAMLAMVKGPYEYQHIYDKVLKELKTAKFNDSIVHHFAALKEKYNISKKSKDKERDEDHDLKALDAYGWEGYSILDNVKDDLKKEIELQNKPKKVAAKKSTKKKWSQLPVKRKKS